MQSGYFAFPSFGDMLDDITGQFISHTRPFTMVLTGVAFFVNVTRTLEVLVQCKVT